MKTQQICSFNPKVVMPRMDAHVVPMGKLWAIKMETNTTYSGIFSTQLEATAYAIGLARMAASSVILHNKDGQFREVWSYPDPNKPRIMA